MTEKWDVRYIGNEIRIYSESGEFVVRTSRYQKSGNNDWIMNSWVRDHNSLVDRIRELEGENNG